VDVLDVAHPLIRRLVDLAREQAAHPDATGRIAAASADTPVVTGLLHVLARYVAAGNPPVLLEELLPISLSVWGDDSIPSARHLIGTLGLDRGHDRIELNEAASELLGRQDLDAVVETAAAEQAQALANRHATIDAPWAQGLDDVSVVSWDVLALTICYPRTAS
jgi:hypothetical protein